MNRDDIKNIFGQKLQAEIDEFTKESRNFNKPLYHYTKFEVLDDILRRRKLRLSHYSLLNDEMEIKHSFNIVFMRIFEQIGTSQYSNFWEYFHGMLQRIKNCFEFYICSFTENYTNDFLWEEYANNKGICIGFHPDYFRPDNAFRITNRLPLALERVFYHEEEFKLYIENLINIIEITIEETIINFTSDLYPLVTSELAIFILPIIPKLKKSVGDHGESWENENELRIYHGS